MKTYLFKIVEYNDGGALCCLYLCGAIVEISKPTKQLILQSCFFEVEKKEGNTYYFINAIKNYETD